ncbi:MAG: GNAT family N-acetyltransferase [Anaerolineales bacterium]|nr:GNAT family N-acetyltransferase [Anaerolineales bacterium]
MSLTITRPPYTLSTDRARIDVAFVHAYLSHESYWAHGRALETVQRSIDHSLCVGIYLDTAQVGFARLVTDYATFAWLCDVFIAADHRGRGLGKWLIESIVGLEELRGVKRLLLATADAHGLYRAYGGFEPLPNPEKWMTRRLS